LINKVKHLQTVSFCLFDFYFAKVANLGYTMLWVKKQENQGSWMKTFRKYESIEINEVLIFRSASAIMKGRKNRKREKKTSG